MRGLVLSVGFLSCWTKPLVWHHVVLCLIKQGVKREEDFSFKEWIILKNQTLSKDTPRLFFWREYWLKGRIDYNDEWQCDMSLTKYSKSECHGLF